MFPACAAGRAWVTFRDTSVRGRGARPERDRMTTSDRTDWGTILLLCAMYAVLLGNVALYRWAPLPLWCHVLVAAAGIHLAFTVWHEGVHRNVARQSWVNTTVGILGIFPYMAPYFFQRWIHLAHHKRLNQVSDPNRIYADGPFWKMPLRYPRAVRYAHSVVREDPRTRTERLSDALTIVVIVGIFVWAWQAGTLGDALLLWALPVVLAKVVMDWYINYLPHVGLPADRFLGTRIVDVPWLTPLVLGHNYHAIHHLWPGIPWHRYRTVFHDKRDYLVGHGVPIENWVFGARGQGDQRRAAGVDAA